MDKTLMAVACLAGTLRKEADDWVVYIPAGQGFTNPYFRYSNWKAALVHWAYFYDRAWYDEHWGNPLRELGDDRITR